MKDKIAVIETKNRKYPICFNLNVMEEIQEKYGTITAWGDLVSNKEGGEPKIKELKDGLLMMINEAIDLQNETRAEGEEKQELVSSKQVGRIITEVGFAKTTQIIMDLSKKSTDTGENSKNE